MWNHSHVESCHLIIINRHEYYGRERLIFDISDSYARGGEFFFCGLTSTRLQTSTQTSTLTSETTKNVSLELFVICVSRKFLLCTVVYRVTPHCIILHSTHSTIYSILHYDLMHILTKVAHIARSFTYRNLPLSHIDVLLPIS